MLMHCVACTGLFSTAAVSEDHPETDAVVAIDEEPSHHLVLWTRALRVFDVSFLPGAVSLWHRHEKDSVLLCLDGADVPSEEPGKPLEVRPPIPAGRIYYKPYEQKPYVHRIRNVDRTAFRILDIEVLARPRPNAVSLDPLDEAWQVLIDNDRVRVSKILLKSRTATAPVRFKGARLFVALTEGVYAIESSTRSAQRLKVGRGDLRAVDEDGIETVRNLAASELELAVVEVK
ncbi:hypothetical protein [Eleftheria terrae]|uniref:hypothetical protein n=1 Tax=Eleftheria terrae TaxID=1597781 RepID=UPI00263BC35C|nr:hypothetical protein [Eleftheria terrae]WKB50726.1 hypothetical protein N7L95_12910 [Eleftheria terrae]